MWPALSHVEWPWLRLLAFAILIPVACAFLTLRALRPARIRARAAAWRGPSRRG